MHSQQRLLISFSIFILTFFFSPDAYAQDIFSSGSNSQANAKQDCEGARSQEFQQTSENNAELQKEEIDIENQYRKDMLSCGPAPSAAPCRKEAGEKKTASLVKLNIKRSDESARHDKASVDINYKLCRQAPNFKQQQANQDTTNNTGNSPAQGNRPLLKGGVTKNVGTPPESNGGAPEDGFDDGDLSPQIPEESLGDVPPAAGEVYPPLAALRDVIDSLAPHYDMSKPYEANRIIKDVLIGMALGRITSGVPGALKTLFGKAGKEAGQELGELGGKIKLPGEVPEPSLGGEAPPVSEGRNPLLGNASEVPGTNPIEPSWGNGTQPPGTNPLVPKNSWENPPPGVVTPPMLKTTLRDVFPQERANSCVLACTKMVAQTVTRRSLPESFYQQMARGNMLKGGGYFPKPNYDPLVGTFPREIPKLLDIAGVRNSGLVSTTIDEVASKTATGYPAIVGIKSGAQGHAIVVDAVVGSQGGRSLFVRDPLNLRLIDETSRKLLESAGFTNHGIMSEQEFLSQFTGHAVFTTP